MDSKPIFYFAAPFLALVIFNCSSRKEARDHSAPGAEHEWKALDDFHMIMADAFHPFKDSADLEPAKALAPELFKMADQWTVAALPEQVDTDEVKSRLMELRSDAQKLAQSVKSSDDNEIAEHLTRLHNTFHEIQEHWYEAINKHTRTPAHQH